MKNASHQNVLKEVCDYLGKDLDSPQCEALINHLKACPECEVYFDTIKKTVLMYRKSEEPCAIPLKLKSNLNRIMHLKPEKH